MAKLVFGMNQSLDGYIDHDKFAPGPVLFRHWIEHVRGVTAVPGLYVLGQRWQHRMISHQIGGVGEDARYVADCIAGRWADAA